MHAAAAAAAQPGGQGVVVDPRTGARNKQQLNLPPGGLGLRKRKAEQEHIEQQRQQQTAGRGQPQQDGQDDRSSWHDVNRSRRKNV